MNEAKEVTAALRQQYAIAPDLAMSAWLFLAEGLQAYFGKLDPRARDKILRAHALSAAGSLHAMQARSAAWLSQMDFSTLDVKSMARYMRQALSLAKADDSSTLGRVSLVAAQALHVAGHFDLALPWYRRAHTCATIEGDDSAVSALMHNMVCMRLDNLRQMKLTGIGEDIDSRVIQSTAESTHRFDQMVGASSMSALGPLLHARLHSLQGRPEEALALYQEHIAADADSIFARMRSDILSDVSWCQAQLNRRAEAIATAFDAQAAISDDTQTDDRAATHSRLAWTHFALGDDIAGKQHEKLADDLWESFGKLQADIVIAMSDLPSPEPNRLTSRSAVQ